MRAQTTMRWAIMEPRKLTQASLNSRHDHIHEQSQKQSQLGLRWGQERDTSMCIRIYILAWKQIHILSSFGGPGARYKLLIASFLGQKIHLSWYTMTSVKLEVYQVYSIQMFFDPSKTSLNTWTAFTVNFAHWGSLLVFQLSFLDNTEINNIKGCDICLSCSCHK